jgi:hypothetical protein
MGWKICVQKNSLSVTFTVPGRCQIIFVTKWLMLEAFLNMSLRSSCCSDEAFSGKKRNLWSVTTYLQAPDCWMQD